MGKAEKGTPKYLANKMKSKGLQKLKWYCQMCEKQCRDENGFKCHRMSENHQRQMELFSESSEAYMDQFSKEFLDEFMKLLSRRFGTRRIKANHVYQEYIGYKEHLHMNSTKWHNLTDFCRYLGTENLCLVEESEQGIFIQYIDRSPAALARQKELEKKDRMSQTDEDRNQKMINEQMAMAESRAAKHQQEERELTELARDENDKKISLKVASNPISKKSSQNGLSALSSSKSNGSTTQASKKRPATEKTALELFAEEMAQKKKGAKIINENWLLKGIIVKVVHKKLANGKYYKKKGIVLKVHDEFVGELEMLDTGDILKLDQEDLETVIPQPGGLIKVVNTEHVGCEGTLLKVDLKAFAGVIELSTGKDRGKEISLAYEHFCKLA